MNQNLDITKPVRVTAEGLAAAAPANAVAFEGLVGHVHAQRSTYCMVHFPTRGAMSCWATAELENCALVEPA